MVLEYRVNWSTGGSNPGLSVFHARGQTGSPAGLSSQDLADKCRVFFDQVKSIVAASITINFPGEVLDIDTSTGVLAAVHTITAPANVVCTGTGSVAQPAGARIEWRTPAIVAGRRLRGRTFVVPLNVGSYEANGSLVSAAITTLTTAATNYTNTGVFTNVAPSIWSRTHGIQADITSFLIPDEVAVLRSRRD